MTVLAPERLTVLRTELTDAAGCPVQLAHPSVRFLCCGDLHLGAGADLGREPGDRLREQENVWRTILLTARMENVAAVLFAGDLFEKRRPGPDEMLAAERPLVEHRDEGGPRVIAIPGNHDLPGVADGCGLDVLAEAGLLELYRHPSFVDVRGVTVCCLPWTPISHILAREGAVDRDRANERAAELLVEVARGMRADWPGPAVLLTHFSISGSTLPNGLPVEQLREPVLPLGELEAIGFDSIIGGHIHKAQELATTPDEPYCPIFYVGSPMPLNFGEGGSDHGVWILESHEIVGGVHGWAPRFVAIEGRPLVTLDWPIEEQSNPYDGFVAFGLEDAIVRVRYTATEQAAKNIDHGGLRQIILAAGAWKVHSIQPTIIREERARVKGLTEEIDELRALELWCQANDLDVDEAHALRDLGAKYLAEAAA